MHRKLLVLAAIGTALCNAAAAQPAAPSTSAIPEKVAPGADAPNTDLSKRGGSLSDKLNNSNGVIHPEGAVDPKMQKPAPATGTMPVIPPPGAPDAQPK
ncbi:hypothetical protein [Methylocapsa sp. S129]|uniref:hypothetical protein n=1 Tax=Methylocapsa sp. S129 TaxID=1641869 RepID=UPI00131CA334|nr:hypothetical protein [Methylocapsa sp. S129]